MKRKRTKNRRIAITAVALLLVACATSSSFRGPNTVYAADNNFANGITVDSTGDGADANLADSICDDGSGNCTLRAAIQESNNEAGTQTIKFNIAGSGVHTIQPSTALPDITGTVIIDGYSQPGSSANTAVAPNPLNGTLLIEIDGSNHAFNAFNFRTGSSNSIIKGMIINRFQGNGISIRGVGSMKIQGNYIGTNNIGVTARPNGADNVNSSTAISIGENGLNTTDTSTTDTLVGGLNPEDRNLISGNYGGGLGIGAVDTTILGNYVGVARDGITDLGNSYGSGVTTGGFTIDYADGVFIGSPDTGGANVISGNATGGIQPDYSTNVIIDSNLIGTDYTGTAPIPNDLCGVSIQLSTGSIGTIRNNRIKFNHSSGVRVSGSGTSTGIESNIITDNDGIGVDLQTSSNTVTGNVISNNHGAANVSITAPSGAAQKNVITNNKIGTKPDGSLDPGYTQHIGVAISGNVSETLVGGSNPADRNTIAGNSGGGIIITELVMTGFGTFTPSNNTILGNTIHSNDPGTIFGLSAPGSGIDLLSATLSGFTLQSSADSGANPNDATDADTGANGYINFPVLSSFSQKDTTATVNYSLDAADSPSNQYRVEFFANDTADPSGYGEGQTYLGAVTTAPGNNLTATFTLPTGTDLTGKQISSTTTAIDNTTTSGFGNTSEFSGVVLAAVTPLADTGQNSNQPMLVAGSLVMGGLALFYLSVRKNHGKR